ncbi:hypothetical protein TIFTF001_032244 [Ficus carica]|uniref:Uncharacterized protein n=1 Tax=Ficus carica TaxID=3494 RepID=A0AA88DWB6_FICCA|nr:hypothetical protein TIFTF001_032244 [Ficus carica]
MFAVAAPIPSETLELIDAIQRLGLDYHFEDDISEGIFEKFTNEQGNFNNALTIDAQGMLSLFEATHLMVHGEPLLGEALAFTTTHLKSSTTSSQLSSFLSAHVKHALNQPIRKGLPRVEARHYISMYEENPSHNEVLLNFAKLDFNALQKLHQKELSDVTMLIFIAALLIILEAWKVNCLDPLPEYMKYCYRKLSKLKLYEEIEELLANEGGGSYRVHYAKEAMKMQVQGYFEEANWFHENYVPTMEEYWRVRVMFSGYYVLTLTSFLGMGDVATEEAFEWASKYPKTISAACVICRLMDDITGQKEINEECLVPLDVPMPLLMCLVHFTRVMLYKDGYNYTNAGGITKN